MIGHDKIEQYIPFEEKINSMERGLRPNNDSVTQPLYMDVYTTLNSYFRYFFRGFLYK